MNSTVNEALKSPEVLGI
jgi:hypothetical protein